MFLLEAQYFILYFSPWKTCFAFLFNSLPQKAPSCYGFHAHECTVAQAKATARDSPVCTLLPFYMEEVDLLECVVPSMFYFLLGVTG